MSGFHLVKPTIGSMVGYLQTVGVNGLISGIDAGVMGKNLDLSLEVIRESVTMQASPDAKDAERELADIIDRYMKKKARGRKQMEPQISAVLRANMATIEKALGVTRNEAPATLSGEAVMSMNDEAYHQKLAQLILDYSLQIKGQERVLILGELISKPLIERLYAEILQRGAFPTFIMDRPGLFFPHAGSDQLTMPDTLLRHAFENADKFVYILGEETPDVPIDPEKQALYEQTNHFMELYAELCEREHAFVATLFPTAAYAANAGMEIDAYKKMVYGAMYLHAANPVEQYAWLSEKQRRLVEYLTGKKEIHVIGEGTDLKIGVGGRRWINADGAVNLPDGEVFTGPEEDNVDGHIYFPAPQRFEGHLVRGLRLEFEKGRVVKATAVEGEDFVREKLQQTGGNILGEFAFAMNWAVDAFTGNPLLDEKKGGSVHVALGMSYPITGGQNLKASFHWDIYKDLVSGGRIFVDGELIQINGRFLSKLPFGD